LRPVWSSWTWTWGFDPLVRDRVSSRRAGSYGAGGGGERGYPLVAAVNQLGRWAIPTVVMFTHLPLAWLFVSIRGCLFGGALCCVMGGLIPWAGS